MFVALLGSDLTPLSAYHFGGKNDQKMTSFFDSGNGIIYVGGSFYDSIKLSTKEVLASGGKDAFLALSIEKVSTFKILYSINQKSMTG